MPIVRSFGGVKNGKTPLGLIGTIRPEKAVAVEVNEVAGRVGAPHLRLPRDVRKIAGHVATGGKRGDVDEAGFRSFEQFGEFVVALGVHRAVARNALHEEQPVVLGVVKDRIGHLAVFVDGHAELGEPGIVEEAGLGPSVADVDDLGSRREARSESFDDLSDEFAVAPRGKLNPTPVRDLDGNHLHLAEFCPPRDEGLSVF